MGLRGVLSQAVEVLGDFIWRFELWFFWALQVSPNSQVLLFIQWPLEAAVCSSRKFSRSWPGSKCENRWPRCSWSSGSGSTEEILPWWVDEFHKLRANFKGVARKREKLDFGVRTTPYYIHGHCLQHRMMQSQHQKQVKLVRRFHYGRYVT